MNKISKEELEKLYYDEQLSTRDIAKKMNCGQTTVRRYMKLYNITARSSCESKHTSVYCAKQTALAERYKKEYIESSIQSGHRLLKVCPICNKEFSCMASQELKYCSAECAHLAKRKERHCIRCNTIISNRNAKYCSECLKIVRHENLYNRIETKCATCGATLYVIPSRFNSCERIYCNTECMSKDYINRFSGENNPTWKGGKKHYQGNWLRTRLMAIERDKNCCQLCGKKPEDQNGISMSVHHIRNYRYFDDKQEANQLNNLVCLCKDCHTFVHSNSNTNNIYIQK